MKRHFFSLCILLFTFGFLNTAASQTLDLREICNITYQTDYTSIADRKMEDLFPKGNTKGFVHFYRGVSLLRQRAYYESIKDFKLALTDTTVNRALCNLYLGIAFMQLNMPDSILSMYSKAMKVSVAELKKPGYWENADYVQENSYAAYLMGTNNALHHPADSLLIEALFNYAVKDPEFYDAFYNFGTWQYNMHRYGSAINNLLKARELDQKDDRTLLLCLGYLYRLSGDNEQSIKSYQLLTGKYSDYAPAYNNMGCTQAFIEKYSKAIASLNKAISKENNLNEAWYNRGVIFLKTKKYQKAIEDLSTAIRLQPTLGNAYYFRGFAKKNMGDIPGSIADFSKALELKK